MISDPRIDLSRYAGKECLLQKRGEILLVWGYVAYYGPGDTIQRTCHAALVRRDDYNAMPYSERRKYDAMITSADVSALLARRKGLVVVK